MKSAYTVCEMEDGAIGSSDAILRGSITVNTINQTNRAGRVSDAVTAVESATGESANAVTTCSLSGSIRGNTISCVIDTVTTVQSASHELCYMYVCKGRDVYRRWHWKGQCEVGR